MIWSQFFCLACITHPSFCTLSLTHINPSFYFYFFLPLLNYLSYVRVLDSTIFLLTEAGTFFFSRWIRTFVLITQMTNAMTHIITHSRSGLPNLRIAATWLRSQSILFHTSLITL